LGVKGGRSIHEMRGSLDDTFLNGDTANGLKFGIMSILASPRVALPVSNVKGFREINRDYDISKASIRTIVDHSANLYWEKDNYIRIKNRPYLSLFVARNRLPSQSDDLTKIEAFEYLKEYSNSRYGINPYVVAATQSPELAPQFIKNGADAISSYALLPDFGESALPIQDYKTLLDKRSKDWDVLGASVAGSAYVPPVVVGWDASPRGINDVALSEVKGIYPFTPIVQGADSDQFNRMLNMQYDYLSRNVPEDERYVPITAWNEVTEGAALLPRVNRNGEIDRSLLDVIKNFKSAL
jgi:Glycosyltransferase WbsX